MISWAELEQHHEQHLHITHFHTLQQGAAISPGYISH